MAKIVLDPGEVFEHRHDGGSITELLAGSVEMTLPDRKMTLVQGEPVEVPSGAAHSLQNIGSTVAEVHCRCA